MTSLEQLLQGTPFLSYAYSYPHKTAYRPLDPPLPLSDVWAQEDKAALFLYVHIPFCEMRCGFCNLFTLANPKEGLTARYMDALARQTRQVANAIGDARYARISVGGGTPTQLEEDDINRLFDLLEGTLGATPKTIPVSFESSPATVTLSKLKLLRARGVDRISIGVQSFLEAETKALGRPQRTDVVEQALDWLQEVGFPTRNIDLIYGAADQDEASWQRSLERTMRTNPEEVYLYPLYVRPLTGLGKQDRSWDDHRIALYRQGRDFLLARGYQQYSMRMFRLIDTPYPDAPRYRCQEDGMVGLGAGARSYTRDLHYCTEYAVGRTGVKEILHDYIEREDERFAVAEYGFHFDQEDSQRRFAILSLLSHEGLDCQHYETLFGASPLSHLPELADLLACGLATERDGTLALTLDGLERSDVLGPWLYSAKVRQRADAYELR